MGVLSKLFNEVAEAGRAAAKMVHDFIAAPQEHSFTGGREVNLGSVFAGHEVRAAARLAPVPVKMDGIKKGSPFGNAR